MKKSSLFLVSLFVILAMLLVACGSSTEESAEEPASTTAEEAAPADDEAMAEKMKQWPTMKQWLKTIQIHYRAEWQW